MKQYLSLSILLELAKKEKVTAKYLSQKFEISVRSVYRYLDELESAGIPTFTQVGKNGGIVIEKNFVLDSLLLTEQDKDLLKRLLLSVNTENCKRLMTKLGL